jgi:hypothetical protein
LNCWSSWRGGMGCRWRVVERLETCSQVLGDSGQDKSCLSTPRRSARA